MDSKRLLDGKDIFESGYYEEEDTEYDDLLSRGLSNSWAVHGNYTDSGFPLMANDFHMGANLPAQVTLGELRWGDVYIFGS